MYPQIIYWKSGETHNIYKGLSNHFYLVEIILFYSFTLT